MSIRIAPQIALFALLLAGVTPARALQFTLQRVSDTQAIMTVTGTPDDSGEPGDPDIFKFTTLSLDGVLQNVDVELLVSETGDFAFGTGRSTTGWGAENGSMFALGDPLPTSFSYLPDSTPSGTATLTTVPGLTFADIGTSGAVRGEWQTSTGSSLFEVGTWRVVGQTAVPDGGSTLALLALAVTGLVRGRRSLVAAAN